jgi:pyruvate formate lyase activating enzyme
MIMTPDTGLIFNIQRFSVHDGPGIRTTVFMKGCPLRCLWCSNPESRNFHPEIIIRNVNCRGCGACVDACPRGAIAVTEEEGRKIDIEKCSQCLLCVERCYFNSITQCGKYMTVEEVFREIDQDRLFYKNSGGGVTISGGEALSQADFVALLLKTCKEEGLSTALDTSGHAPWRALAGVLPFVDLVLFDIKHLDSAEHRRATGVGNELILENLRQTSRVKAVWMRIPLISGYNDSVAHVERLAVHARDVGVAKVSLLPYHEGGKSKCEQLCRPYPFPEGKPPEREHVEKLKKILFAHGLDVSVDL